MTALVASLGLRADGLQRRRRRRSAATARHRGDRRHHFLDAADAAGVAGAVPVGAASVEGVSLNSMVQVRGGRTQSPGDLGNRAPLATHASSVGYEVNFFTELYVDIEGSWQMFLRDFLTGPSPDSVAAGVDEPWRQSQGGTESRPSRDPSSVHARAVRPGHRTGDPASTVRPRNTCSAMQGRQVLAEVDVQSFRQHLADQSPVAVFFDHSMRTVVWYDQAKRLASGRR